MSDNEATTDKAGTDLAGRLEPLVGPISLTEAAARGIERLRNPKWVTPEDHLEISFAEGKLNPWLRLYCPFNVECNGRDPVEFLSFQADTEKQEWVPYNGPLPDSEQYKAAVAKFAGCFSQEKPNLNSTS